MLFAIAVGSIVGAALRRAATRLLPDAASTIHFAVSSIGGILLGSLLGWVASMAPPDGKWQQTAMIAIAASLGTFAASSIVDGTSTSVTGTLRFRQAVMHIGAALLSAMAGATLMLWWA